MTPICVASTRSRAFNSLPSLLQNHNALPCRATLRLELTSISQGEFPSRPANFRGLRKAAVCRGAAQRNACASPPATAAAAQCTFSPRLLAPPSLQLTPPQALLKMADKRIGFIGAGQMAEALARGFINKGVCKAEHVFATDPVQVIHRLPRAGRRAPPACSCPAQCPPRECLLSAADNSLLPVSLAACPSQERKEVFRSFGTNPTDGNIEVSPGQGGRHSCLVAGWGLRLPCRALQACTTLVQSPCRLSNPSPSIQLALLSKFSSPIACRRLSNRQT